MVWPGPVINPVAVLFFDIVVWVIVTEVVFSFETGRTNRPNSLAWEIMVVAVCISGSDVVERGSHRPVTGL